METNRIFELFPLAPGECLIASLRCELVEEEENNAPRVQVDLYVSNQRVFAWHPRSPFALDISEVCSIRVIERQVGIAFEGDIVLVHEAASEEEAANFASELWSVRSGVVYLPSRQGWQSGLSALNRDLYDDAQSALLSAAELEECNGCVHLLLSAIQRLVIPQSCAKTLIAAARIASPSIGKVLPSYLAETKLGLTEWHGLKQVIGLDSDPIRDASIPILLIRLIDSCRRGATESVAALAAGIANGIDKPEAYAECAEHPLGYLYRFSSQLCATVAYHFSTRGSLQPIGTALAALVAAPYDCTAALRSLAQVTGNAEPDILANRIGCSWDAQIQRCLADRQLDNLLIEKSVRDQHAMVSLLMHPKILTLGSTGELLWATVRSGRRAETNSVVDAHPADWLQKQLAIAPRDSPTSWIATLAATELLLGRDDHSGALDCLDAGYRDLLGAPASSFDPYRRYAAELYEFYCSLARRDSRRAQLFVNRLAEAHECFEWIPTVLAEFTSAPSTLLPVPDAQLMLEWYGRNRSLFDPDVKLTRSHGNLLAAANANSLRVVIGGETSAGKSSLINALIGAELLYVTQEEATASATILRNGPTYTIRCFGSQGVIDELRFGRILTEEESNEVRAFIRDYTFQSSPKSAQVVRLEISAPLPNLPTGIELIDTPGINGRDTLSRIAEDSIDLAHACIFVFDARNALKRSELRTVKFAISATPKTIFVLNKMDLVLGDDDLDCDTSASEEVVARVEEELSSILGVERVKVAAVSSIAADRLRRSGATPAAVAYAEQVPALRHILAEMLSGSKQRLIGELADRLSMAVTSSCLSIALERATDARTQMARLSQELPPEPDACRAEIEDRIMDSWPNVRSHYINALQSRLNTELDPIYDSLTRDEQACNNIEDFQRFVQFNVPNAANKLLRACEATRKSEWDKLTLDIQSVVNVYFSELYGNLSFTDVQPVVTVNLATPLPLADRVRDLVAGVGDLSGAAKTREYGAAAVGAAIGTVLLPGIGSAAGFFLGKLFGDGMNSDSVSFLQETLRTQFGELSKSAWDCLIADVSAEDGKLPPLLGGIFQSVERERGRLEATVREHILEFQVKLDSERLESEKNILIACEAWEWHQSFQQRNSSGH